MITNSSSPLFVLLYIFILLFPFDVIVYTMCFHTQNIIGSTNRMHFQNASLGWMEQRIIVRACVCVSSTKAKVIMIVWRIEITHKQLQLANKEMAHWMLLWIKYECHIIFHLLLRSFPINILLEYEEQPINRLSSSQSNKLPIFCPPDALNDTYFSRGLLFNLHLFPSQFKISVRSQITNHKQIGLKIDFHENKEHIHWSIKI